MAGVRAPESVVGGDLVVVGEDDRAGHEFGAVDGLEAADRVRGAVRLVGGLVGELEEVHEPGRVVGLLPGGVHHAARFVRRDVGDELLYRGPDLVHGRGLHLIVGGLVDGHSRSPRIPAHLPTFNTYVEYHAGGI